MDRRMDFAGRQLHIHSNLAMTLASQGGIKRGHDGEHREPYLLFVVFTTARMPVVKHFRRRAISWPETIQRRCDVQVCELYCCRICTVSTSTRTTTAAAARLFSSCTTHRPSSCRCSWVLRNSGLLDGGTVMAAGTRSGAELVGGASDLVGGASALLASSN